MSQSSPHFFALSNDIYDALYSSRSRYPDSRLRRYAIKRGIILSNLLSREELCLRIAGLSFSYNDFKELTNNISKTSKKPRSQSTNLDQVISPHQVQNVIDKLKLKHTDNDIKINVNRENVTTLTSDYSVFDRGHTRLKQRVLKRSKIEIAPSKEGGGKIISSSDDHTQKMVASLLSLIEQEDSITISSEVIDLSIFNPSQVNKFFIDLANSVPDLGFSQAVSVKLQKSNIQVEDELEEADADAQEFSLLTTINSASMSGGNILQSPQISSFLSGDEYYIHTLRWESNEVFFEGVPGALLYIEIKVTPPVDRTDFSFDILSYRKRIEKDHSFSSSKITMTGEHKKQFIETLQQRAYELYNEIKNEVSME